jgi:ADP-ribosyl-[dinitrogen reductase] hydrolase
MPKNGVGFEMNSTELRRSRINGLLLGIAIGDALGLPRHGLTRRQALKHFGAGPCTYGKRLGKTGFATAQVFATAQSIVSSGTERENFAANFLKRLGWYSISFPTDMPWATRKVGLANWFRRVRLPEVSRSDSSEAAIRSPLIVLALHNTNLGTRNWIEHSVRITHCSTLVGDGCHALAALTNLIIECKEELDSPAVAKFIAEKCTTKEFKDHFQRVAQFLQDGSRCSTVAQHFGWSEGIPSSIVPAVVMSIYCFLRHKDFQKAIESAMHLGGDTCTTGAIVGGLAGTLYGARKIPSDLVDKLSNKSYGPTWIEDMSHRLAQWPHGADDLMDAPALPADPLGIVLGNLYRKGSLLTQGIYRVPCKLASSPPAKVRHSVR